MPRGNPIQSAFNAGELSPRLVARVDFAKYRNAGEVCRNMLPLPHGGVQRRPGSKFVAEVKTSADGAVRLVPFVFSTVQAYVLEFGDAYIRFYKDQGQIQSGMAAYEIVSPYAIADLPKLKWAQSADTMYLVHPDYAPRKLTRTGHTSWTIAEVDFIDGPYLDENATATTLTPSGTTGSGITITASNTTGINGGTGFTSADIGRLVRIKHAADWGYAVITNDVSTTVVDADVVRDFSATTASTEWQLGAWSIGTGFPRAVTFFEQRLCFAGNEDQPQTFWMSQSADLENFRPDSFDAGTSEVTIEADDAVTYTIAAQEVNAILWLSAGRDLVIGTVGGEWTVGSDGAVITPTDIVVRQRTKHGSADIQPLRVGDTVLFVQSARRKLLELGFAFEVDGYRAADLTILAEHVSRGGFKEIAYQQEPDSVVWAVRDDGVLAAMTYRRDQDVVGWGRCPLGGSFGTGGAVVEAVAVIPGNATSGSEDRSEVWLAVKRTINGTTERYIEFLEGAYEGPLRDEYATEALWEAAVLEAQQDAFYVDSGLTYDGVAADTISGLDHLEGETVKVLADGAIHPDETVSGGAITLDYEASKVHVGLGYTHVFRSLKMLAGAAAGTAVGKTKRIHRIAYVLQDAATYQHGPDADNLTDVEFRQVGDAMDTAVPLFTGERRLEFDGDYDTDPRVMVQSDAPAPFMLLAWAPELKTNEGP